MFKREKACFAFDCFKHSEGCLEYMLKLFVMFTVADSQTNREIIDNDNTLLHWLYHFRVCGGGGANRSVPSYLGDTELNYKKFDYLTRFDFSISWPTAINLVSFVFLEMFCYRQSLPLHSRSQRIFRKHYISVVAKTDDISR